MAPGRAPGEELLAAPPLVQRDLAHPAQVALPSTPLPPVNPDWIAAQREKASREEPGGVGGEETDEENSQVTAAEHLLPAAVVDMSQLPPQERTTPAALTETAEEFSLHVSSSFTRTDPSISISLLKQVRVRLHTPDGISREVKLRRGENGIRLILLAYIA